MVDCTSVMYVYIFNKDSVKIILTPLMIIGSFANFFVLFAIWKKPNIFGERKSFNWLLHFFISNEFVLGLWGIIETYTEEYVMKINHIASTFLTSLVISFALVESSTLLYISLDRFFAVVRPTETRYWNVQLVKRLTISTALSAFIC